MTSRRVCVSTFQGIEFCSVLSRIGFSLRFSGALKKLTASSCFRRCVNCQDYCTTSAFFKYSNAKGLFKAAVSHRLIIAARGIGQCFEAAPDTQGG